jgi:hypothetical protein
MPAMSNVRRLRPVIFALLLALGAAACTVDRPQARPSAATPTPTASPGPPAALCTALARLNAALEAYQSDTIKAAEPSYPDEVESDEVDAATLKSKAAAAVRAALELRPKLSTTPQRDLNIVMNAVVESSRFAGSTQWSRLLEPMGRPATRSAWRRLVVDPGCPGLPSA